MKTVEALKWRYAVKKFDSERILDDEVVQNILEALTLTPTSMGMQLLDFLVISNKDIQSKLTPLAYNQSQVSDASHLIVLCRKDKVTELHIDNYVANIEKIRGFSRDSENMLSFGSMLKNTLNMEDVAQKFWMENQVYIALGNLLTVCAMEKVDACPMEGFDRAAFDKALNLEDKGLKSVLLCPIGVRCKEDKYAELPKVRRTIEDTVTFITKKDTNLY